MRCQVLSAPFLFMKQHWMRVGWRRQRWETYIIPITKTSKQKAAASLWIHGLIQRWHVQRGKYSSQRAEKCLSQSSPQKRSLSRHTEAPNIYLRL